VRYATVEAGLAFALSLPEAGESPHFESTSFRVRGKIFVTVPPDEEHVHVLVDEDETAAASSASRMRMKYWCGARSSGA
jgi:YjbR